MEIEKEKITIEENSKIWPAVFSWGFFLLSLIVSTFVPGVRDGISNIRIIRIFKDAIIDSDPRLILMIVGFLAFAFLVMYGIEFYNKKFQGYVPPQKTEVEMRKALHSFWLIMNIWKMQAVIAGTIILIASLFGISLK